MNKELIGFLTVVGSFHLVLVFVPGMNTLRSPVSINSKLVWRVLLLFVGVYVFTVDSVRAFSTEKPTKSARPRKEQDRVHWRPEAMIKGPHISITSTIRTPVIRAVITDTGTRTGNLAIPGARDPGLAARTCRAVCA